MVERVVATTLTELRRAEREVALRAEQIDLQLRLASRVWERDALQLHARTEAHLAEHRARERTLHAQLTVAQLWLAHALAALAGNQRKYQEEQGHDEHSSFWEARRTFEQSRAEKASVTFGVVFHLGADRFSSGQGRRETPRREVQNPRRSEKWRESLPSTELKTSACALC